MTARLDLFSAAPDVLKAMLDLSAKVKASSLEPALQHLVMMRASQINGCANCLNMHAREARAAGETEERLHLLVAWREAPGFSEREQAALAWTEALTLVATTHAPDADYARLRASFTDREQVELTLLINTINAWNRFAVGFRVFHDGKPKHVG
jgi:AhpD family alkylhydroperoxidase